ncbi:unnamed protein product [Adineta steineri]|uniref:EGF-like domain-containing protein n=1 Tax=Adineta steineri TaxID=433720 RepID=A0A818R3W3_9BILA|nr:unnamed protein product [Adineta steineri]
MNWLIPFHLIEQYAVYLDDNENNRATEATICNCSQNSIGRYCEYNFNFRKATPGNWLGQQTSNVLLNNYETLTRLVDGIVCPGADIFLEWRHICDGFTQCTNGADELDCHLLEFFKCETDEFQCRNGMCIPIEFAFDATSDCMDLSDEQALDVLHRKYHNCVTQSSFECDDQLCHKDQFSCGNGECVPWSAILNDKKDCSNFRDIAYICEVSNLASLTRGEWPGICKQTIELVPPLTNSSDCRQTLGHLLQTNPQQQLSELAVINLRTRCENSILYFEQNAFFAGLKMIYNRSIIERFFSNPSNSRKPVPKAPDLYYFTGAIVCDGISLNISEEIWFSHRELQELTSYPFFPLFHLICQKIMNQSLSNMKTENNLGSSISPSFYRCKNTSDRLSLRRINDGYIDCLYGDDERNSDYPMTQLFRYQCQTVTSPSQYVSYAKLGDGVVDCADGSDEVSSDIRWSTFKCDLEGDNYACWVFQGDQLGENRLKDVRLHFHRYCDSIWDKMDGQDEKNCSHWMCDTGLYKCNRSGQCIERKSFCDGELDCDDGEDEVNCPQILQKWKLELNCNNNTEYFCITDEYIKNQSLNRSCISWHQVGDGHIDCIGARDERNVASCPDHRMVGDRFLCDNGRKCINYMAVCNGIKDCVDETDESICYWNTELIHFWEYPISPLDFLPVLRITKVLRFPARSFPWLCSHNYCENNGTCHQREDNRFLCICAYGWKGKLCEMKTEHIHCASHSLARTENICVCPEGYFEPYCYVRNLKCQQHNCKPTDTCIPRSHHPIYGYTCICNTSNCNVDRPVISVQRQEPNQSPFLLQLLQLTGDYPTIRQQILVQSLTSFPLIQMIKTRDGTYAVGEQPEIGLLFTFETNAHSIETTLYLLFINCSNEMRNFSVNLDQQVNKCHVLPENQKHAVTLFGNFCQSFTYGSCFISDGYLCYCGYPNKNQSNCLSYQRRYTNYAHLSHVHLTVAHVFDHLFILATYGGVVAF